MEPQLKIQCKPIDFELCDLLGEGSADFLVLCFDGVQFEKFGTPYDTPKNRKDRQELVDRLNDRSAESWWPDVFNDWKPQICAQYGLPPETTAETYRPVCSIAISRVCHGYSEHLHAAVGLFAQLGDKISGWAISNVNGTCLVQIHQAGGYTLSGFGEDLPLLIASQVKRVLTSQQNNNAVE